MAKFGIKQSDFSKGLTITGSLLVSGSQTVTGSVTSTTGFTGSLFGTSSFALTASYVSASNIDGLTLSQITSGSVTASVSTDPSNLFLIKSGSFSYINIASNSNTTVNSNLFIIKNFTTQQPVLTVSQSLISFATQSNNPAGTAPNGAFWFTSTNLYVGLD